MKINRILSFVGYALGIMIVLNSVWMFVSSAKILAFVQLCLALLLLADGALILLLRRRRMYSILRTLQEKVGGGASVMENCQLPVMMSKGNSISWYNNAFRSEVLSGKDVLGESVEHFVPRGVENLSGFKSNITISKRNYTVFGSNDTDVSVYYFVDVTDFDNLKFEFDMTRIVLGYITIDNLDELSRGLKDSERADMAADIEKCIEQWSNTFDCMIKKITAERFLVITNHRGLEHLRQTKFELLKIVKHINFGEKGNATLSMGFGTEGEDFDTNQRFAADALDMALGRGGDQVAIKNHTDYEFFGGTTATNPNRSKVRTRVVSASLSKLIRENRFVIIMGHKNADLDCIGSAVGLSRAVQSLGRQVKIVYNSETCLCNNLVEYVAKESKSLFITPEEALNLITEDTLLIITDTQRRAFLESPELFDKANTVAVFDHHRKTVDYISSSVIFYHEPYSSSASEMVSEILQYMSVKVSKCEAEALLAGIMLDTKNFVLHTNSRTFEASAFLRGCGANPVVVKGFFQNSVDVFKERASLVSSASIYGRFALSYTNKTGSSIMLASAQAADEMLSIEGVDASFVAYPNGDGINISARSLGEVNVQLIMEKLGGGGHLTMAAAQLSGESLQGAVDKLVEAIDGYKKENS